MELKCQHKWFADRVCSLFSFSLYLPPSSSPFVCFSRPLFLLFIEQAHLFQAATETIEGLFKEYQDAHMKELTDKLAQLDVRLVDIVVHLDEGFYPLFLTAIAGRRWLLEHDMKLFLNKCLNSSEYRTMLGKFLSYTVRRGMQEGLSVGIEHGKEGRKLEELVANNPDAEADYHSAYQAFYGLEFPLLAELSSFKDSNIKDVMRLFQLDTDVADALGLVDLQHSL